MTESKQCAAGVKPPLAAPPLHEVISIVADVRPRRGANCGGHDRFNTRHNFLHRPRDRGVPASDLALQGLCLRASNASRRRIVLRPCAAIASALRRYRCCATHASAIRPLRRRRSRACGQEASARLRITGQSSPGISVSARHRQLRSQRRDVSGRRNGRADHRLLCRRGVHGDHVRILNARAFFAPVRAPTWRGPEHPDASASRRWRPAVARPCPLWRREEQLR